MTAKKNDDFDKNIKDLVNFGGNFLESFIFNLRKKTILYSFSVGAVVGVIFFLLGANYG